MYKTVIFNENSVDFDELLVKSAKAIRQGELVVFPTETVYGIGADFTNEKAVKNIFKVKNRPSDNPLIIHVSSIEMALKLIDESVDKELFIKLASKFWPGAISFILKKSDLVGEFLTGGLDTVALRMPSGKIARQLIEKSGTAIAAPSANISGKPSSTRSSHVSDDFNGLVPYIITTDQLPIGVESTVLDLSTGQPLILRPGAVTKDDLERELGYSVEVFCQKESEKPKSPGLKYKHYSPNAAVFALSYDFVYKGDTELIKYLNLQEENEKEDIKIKYLEYPNESEMAKHLFADFRTADKENYHYIAVKSCKKEGLGIAVINRLLKASENKKNL